MKRIGYWGLGIPSLSLVALLVAACAPKATELQPPEIVYGQAMCDECGMIISEARFAAATLTTAGQPHKFDDIGDMLVYHMDHPEEQVRAWFVHDHNSRSWMRGETAFYVLSTEIKSPMGHGLAAFADRKAAEAFAGQLGAGARLLTFDELRVEMHNRVHG